MINLVFLLYFSVWPTIILLSLGCSHPAEFAGALSLTSEHSGADCFVGALDGVGFAWGLLPRLKSIWESRRLSLHS